MLTDQELEDLAQLQRIVAGFAAEVVIIGAAALRCFINLARFTQDLDLVVTLDFEDFAAMSALLREHGWRQEPHKEYRWHAPSGSLIDLLPAGPNLSAAKRIVWPDSQFEMSLVGFEHVFTRASLFSFAQGFRYKVAPPSVLALLKIASYTDNAQARGRDLIDLAALLRSYEAASDRIFSDDVCGRTGRHRIRERVSTRHGCGSDRKRGGGRNRECLPR